MRWFLKVGVLIYSLAFFTGGIYFVFKYLEVCKWSKSASLRSFKITSVDVINADDDVSYVLEGIILEERLPDKFVGNSYILELGLSKDISAALGVKGDTISVLTDFSGRTWYCPGGDPEKFRAAYLKFVKYCLIGMVFCLGIWGYLFRRRLRADVN